MKLETKRFRFFNSTHWFYVVLVCFWVLPSIAWAENRVEAERENWEVYVDKSRIFDLAISDDKSSLWVATSGSLEKIDILTGSLKKIYTKKSGLPYRGVGKLLPDGQGGIWVGAVNGLAHLSADESWEVFTDLPFKMAASLLPDGQGSIWVGSEVGLAHLESDGSWSIFYLNSYNPDLPDLNFMDYVSVLLSDGQGGIWAGVVAEENSNIIGGLIHIKIDGTQYQFTTFNSELPNNNIRTILSDKKGGLWIGTDKGLAHLKADDTWDVFNTETSGLPSNHIKCLLSDGQGGVWVGTSEFSERTVLGGDSYESGGLAHLQSDGTCEIFDKDDFNLPTNTIFCILSDGANGLWIGTNSGLAHLRPDNTWESFNRKYANLPDNTVNFLLPDGKNGIWVGTGVGLGHLKADNSWDVFTEDNSDLPHDWITSLLSDHQSGIWIGTFATDTALTHLKADNSWEILPQDNSNLPMSSLFSPVNWTTSLISDNQGGIWMGKTFGGLQHLTSDGKMEFITQDNSCLPSNTINCLLSDAQGGIWIGFLFSDEYFGGLGHLNADGTCQVFTPNNSVLPSNFVSCLLSDGKGGIWVGTQSSTELGFTSIGGLVHIKSDGTWQVFDKNNSGLPNNSIESLMSDGQGGIWVRTGGSIGLAHMKKDGAWDVYDKDASSFVWVVPMSPDGRGGLLPDGKGGIWLGSGLDGLYHLLLLGTPEQLIKPNSPEITIKWFLNSSSLDYQNVKYVELQRSLSQDGVYETVLDASDKPVRFYADYSICPKPRVDNCWVTVEGHTPETKTNSDGSTTKGYTLNTTIEDPEWLEGLPRYYRLSAIIEEDSKLVRVANNNEAALITPQVEEKPRVELTLDKNAIAMQPNTKAEITVFVSSLDLFRGNVDLEIESGDSVANSNNINAKLESSTLSLKAGETKPVLLTLEAFAENTQSIKIIPKIQSGYSGKSASLNVQVSDGTNSMVALSIAHKTKRARVLDSLTISGNVIPAQAGQSVVISGNHIKEFAESATFTTDEKGYFQGSVTPIHAGLLTLTAQSNGITSNTAAIFILPARTNIALSSNVNQSTKKGDILRVQGIITPVRLDGTKVNLDIRYLDPANQDAGLQPQFVGGVEIDANGVFYRDVVVPGNGFINVKASLPETSDYLSVNTKLVIPIGQPVGEGIIVVSESGNADFQTISKSLGNYVYNALKSRNIPAERIKYLGLGGDKIIADFKINDSLAAENFGKTNKANLHDALTNWATTLFSTDDPYKTPLNLYLIGKVEDDNNGFRLNDSEVLTADDLAQYLDEAEEIIKTNSKDNYSEYKGFPVTIVLEGTQSGKWIEKIAGNGRIILTSSSDKPIDEGGFAGYDNLGESSFSRYFYQFINYGSDIEGAFAEANYEILKFYRHIQKPVMDADGDGFGTTNFDRYEASGKFIEYRPSGNLRPQIRTTNPDMTINREDTQNNFLWAIATDPENEMGGVFCSISSITDPSNRTVNIEMKQKSDKVNVYEADLSQTYPNLATGCYQAVYYAKDKAGNVSLPEQKFLNVIANSGVFLEAPQIKITTKGNMVTVSWSEVANADGYKLFYCPYPDCLPADIGEIDMGNQRTITFDGKGFAFYGAVKAYNSNGLSGWSNVEFFNLR
ncbi:MAG: hypothetical protein HQK63_05400 [Desulfamplus sp.]|nr:hypothetical protein [Desulfamplus sp.]